MCLASSRIRSWRSFEGLRPSSRKMVSMTVRAIGGLLASWAVCLVASRWGLAVRGQRRCRSLSHAIAWVWVSSSR